MPTYDDSDINIPSDISISLDVWYFPDRELATTCVYRFPLFARRKEPTAAFDDRRIASGHYPPSLVDVEKCISGETKSLFYQNINHATNREWSARAALM
jgi:hypothetical protein